LGDIDEDVFQMSRFYAKHFIDQLKAGNFELLQVYEFPRYVFKNKISENEHNFNLEKIRLALKLIGKETNMSEFESAVKKQKKN
jgi:hypothetical protein